MTRTVGLEEHMSSPEVMAAWRRHDPNLEDAITRWTVSGSVAAPLLDLGSSRIADMDTAGVDVAVLSLTSPGLQNLPPAEAVALQTPTNDRIAEAVRAHPDRFRGFATLATPDPAAAAAELHRAVTELGLDGALLHSTTHDVFHDDPRYDELFEVAEHHRAPIYLHPTVPPASVTQAYYEGFGLLATGAPGWHYQTGIALLRLMLAGVLDRHPDLRLIVGHWGEMIPFFLDRISLLDQSGSRERTISEYLQHNVFVTPGGIGSERYLRWSLEVLGPDRIMHATDYPFNAPTDFAARAFLDAADLDDSTREAIGHGTWDRLVGEIRR